VAVVCIGSQSRRPSAAAQNAVDDRLALIGWLGGCFLVGNQGTVLTHCN
jgi:hypothetical protein